MREVVLRLVVLSSLVACGVFTSQPDPVSPAGEPSGEVTWPELVQCGPDAHEIIGTVSRVLLDDGPINQSDLGTNAIAELEDLARKHGPETVACMVDLLIKDWTSVGAAASPERVGAANRGANFLRTVGTKVEASP